MQISRYVFLPVICIVLQCGPTLAEEPADSDAATAIAYASRSGADLAVPISEVLALLADVDAVSRWLFLSESAFLLDEADSPRSDARVRLLLKPMLGQPAQDAILMASSSVSPDGKTVSIRMVADPQSYPEIEPYRRITQLNVQIDVTSLAPALTRVGLSVRVTPVAPIPAFARPFLGMGTQLSLGYMKQLLASGRYRDAATILDEPGVRAFYRGVSLP